MEKTKILIVEDEVNIAKLVQYNLNKSGYIAEITVSAEDAQRYLSDNNVDLIVLDIMLPGMDGLQLCKWIRKQPLISTIPVILLTAKGEEIDRIMGFESGADDYVVKPFSPRELVLRITAVLKRGSTNLNEDDVMIFGDISVNISKREVLVSTNIIDLTKLEFDLLVTLIDRKGRVQTRDRLLDDVWDIAADVTTRTVDTHIKRLRQKLGKAGDYIHTVRGVGYKLKDA